MDNPSKSDWRKLYQAAIKFQQISPWTWMGNEDLFAVENPDSGELGYCSILGSGKEEFGLGIFLGARGFKRYLEVMSTEAGPEGFDEGIMTPMLSLLFANRQELQKEDIEVIRSLGLQFRGRNAWPLFRSQRPGYAPWFLEKEEGVFLTAAIEQALVVSNKVHNNKLDLFDNVDEDLVFTRYYRGGEWREEWRSPELSPRDLSNGIEAKEVINEAELLLLRNSADKLSGSWEVDIFVLPIPIGPPSSRPYFPICFLVVEGKQGLIIDSQMTEPWITLSQKRDTVIQILKRARQLPRNIRVKSEKVREILEPVIGSLGISLRMGPLPLLEEAKIGLRSYLSGRGA